MNDLTAKQAEILAFVTDCLKDEGYIPTLREIAARFGFRSVNSVNDHLAALEKKGYIARRPGSSRGITLLRGGGEAQEQARGIPIVGRAAAGKPITAIENLEGYLELDSIYGAEHFALHIHGDSMVNAGIWDGDFVIVREQPRVNNGEIGVAIVEGEATVKRIRINGRMAELIPENEFYRPLYVDMAQKDFRVAGKVVGVHRVIR